MPLLAGHRPLTLTDPAPSGLYLGLLGHFQRVVYLNAGVPDRALQLGVPKKELDGSQVFGPALDQGRLCASQGVRPVAGPIQAQLSDLSV